MGQLLFAPAGAVTYTGRIKTFPDGTREYLVCSKPLFRSEGWEKAGWKPSVARKGRKGSPKGEEGQEAASGGCGPDRAMRRARAQVRELALCTPFKYFVTLTLDAARVDRYDIAAVTRKLNAWLDNAVRRRGLAYVLVPERHRDGAIHFHGFFNDALPVTDSGTISLPEGGKPRRPRSEAQRAAWLAGGGHVVFNLPGWTLGFTTAIEVYGDYRKAVGYVCKYIGKQGEKIGGRWYYSGGDLRRPEVTLCDLDWRDAQEMEGVYTFTVDAAGAAFAMWTEGPEGLSGAMGKSAILQFSESQTAAGFLAGQGLRAPGPEGVPSQKLDA